MCTRVDDKRLVELVTEVIGLPRSVNGYSGMVNGTVTKQEINEEDNEDDITLMVNDTINKQEIKEENSKDDITLISSSDIQLSTENQTPEDYINYQIFDVQSQKHKIQNQSLINNIPKKKV